ncbi:hypothetical protein NIES23_05030 [Trichormus variabilis NIES-23]|uniref:Uncharacterized protein n=1 Tax=Trichormus variabilis NIES-23 TaxID=1973479 RepID=A0A1Z4KFG0_ANAVA|nr:hypothetical protein NIES23_05030 [Trichormus variabilis NIES-23]
MITQCVQPVGDVLMAEFILFLNYLFDRINVQNVKFIYFLHDRSC